MEVSDFTTVNAFKEHLIFESFTEFYYFHCFILLISSGLCCGEQAARQLHYIWLQIRTGSSLTWLALVTVT